MKIRVLLRGYPSTALDGSTDVWVTVDVPITDPHMVTELKRISKNDYVSIEGVSFVEAEE